MKRITKIFSLVLAVLMLLACLASCGGDASKGTNGKDTVDTSESQVYGNYDCELSDDFNYNDREITILSRDSLAPWRACAYVRRFRGGYSEK